jgi:hypothetical protein
VATPASPPLALEGRELLIRLSRAVQRATIYPANHPAVRGTTGPFFEAAAAHLKLHPQVIVGVTRERVLVGTGDAPPVEYESSWLSRRLSARGIASIAFNPNLTADEAVRLVTWLAGGDELGPDSPAPHFDGAVVSAVDFAHVRFHEAPLEAAESVEAAMVWQSISQTLVGEWHNLVGELPPAPVDVARCALEAIDGHEGTGVRGLASRLFGLGAEIAALPPVVQDAVKQRLGEFVAALTPELRGQLLTVVSSDDPGKIEVLSQLVDRLPRAQVIEVIHNLEITRGGSNHKFLDLMVKLVSVAASDPALAEAVDERCRQQGLPPDLAYLDAPEVKRVLEEMFAVPREVLGPVSPDEYQSRLESLTYTAAGLPRQYDPGRQVDPQATDTVSMQVALIALQVMDGGSTGDKVASLSRLERELPHFLAAGRFDTLAKVYEASQQVFESGAAVDDAVSAQAGAIEEFFRRPETTAAVVEAFTNDDVPGNAPLHVLARAGGPKMAEAALLAIMGSREPAGRRRLTAALHTLDPDVVRSVLAAIYHREPGKARALLAAVSSDDAPVPAEVALIFVGDNDPGVRLDSYRLLLAGSLTPARFESLVRRALDDVSPRIIDLALGQLEKRSPMPGARALGEFLSDASAARWERQQRRAVELLARSGDAAACAALATSLDTRHRRFDAPSRRVSLAMATALGGCEDAVAQAASRAYRRSPAGMLGRLLGDARRGAP